MIHQLTTLRMSFVCPATVNSSFPLVPLHTIVCAVWVCGSESEVLHSPLFYLCLSLINEVRLRPLCARTHGRFYFDHCK
ncbi:hypothetical protein TSMEX_011418 [Taenia solium]|eukprot:TsM_000139800 transcript=TsM_000139800 gene=TsM_000139800